MRGMLAPCAGRAYALGMKLRYVLPRSARAALALVLSLGLSACAGLSPQATDRVKVFDGSLTVAGPKGYCVAPSARRDTAQGSYVLFASCAAVSGDAMQSRASLPAMLSATVGPEAAAPLEPAFPAFVSFFHSPQGRAAIARSGVAKDVEILTVQHRGHMLLLKISDRSTVSGAPVAQVYWRAITSLGGRITALSVLPMRGTRLSDKAQIQLLESFDAAIRAAQTTPSPSP